MSARRPQRGAALLLFLVVAVIAFTAALVSGFGKWATPTTASRNVNAQVLAQAKTALIGYVAKEVLDLSENVPGRLPCPESPGDAGTSNEGRAGGNCGAAASPTVPAIGRLPWRTLGVDKLVDASAEPLWYAVSPKWVTLFAIPPVPPMINDGTTGDLTLDGTGNVVAVIFAPGRPISTNPTAAQSAEGCAARSQTRSDRSHVASGGDPDYRDYLECQNATAPMDSAFGTAITGNDINLAINDQAVIITASDVLNAIQGPLAERLQRTIAPLLSEYSTLWPSGNFLPYAAAFATPESIILGQQCGPSATSPQANEGLLPLASNAGTCVSTWGNFSISGSVASVGCTTLPSTNVQCTFRYYQLVGLGLLLGGASSTDVTIQATAPHAAASFRIPLKPSDVIVPPGLTAQSATFTPRTDGDARLSLVVRVTGTHLCDNILLGLVCNLLPGLVASPVPVSIEFPQLSNAVTLQGSKLSPTVMNNNPSLNLLNALPAGTVIAGAPPTTLTGDDPHYWFMKNEWYRYTYYAVAPGTSAAQTAGGTLTVNLFPSDYGSSGDKRFVLAVMGPALTGQSRPSSDVTQYIEGDNRPPGVPPRAAFAYQVYNVSGNDRVATCPFGPGASICD